MVGTRKMLICLMDCVSRATRTQRFRIKPQKDSNLGHRPKLGDFERAVKMEETKGGNGRICKAGETGKRLSGLLQRTSSNGDK